MFGQPWRLRQPCKERPRILGRPSFRGFPRRKLNILAKHRRLREHLDGLLPFAKASGQVDPGVGIGRSGSGLIRRASPPHLWEEMQKGREAAAGVQISLGRL